MPTLKLIEENSSSCPTTPVSRHRRKCIVLVGMLVLLPSPGSLLCRRKRPGCNMTGQIVCIGGNKYEIVDDESTSISYQSGG